MLRAELHLPPDPPAALVRWSAKTPDVEVHLDPYATSIEPNGGSPEALRVFLVPAQPTFIVMFSLAAVAITVGPGHGQ